MTIMGPLFKLLGTPLGVYRPANLYGEHNDEVLRELGFNDDEIAEFRSTGVIGDELPTIGAATVPGRPA